MDGLAPWQVLATLREAIVALPAEPFAQVSSDAWTIASRPFNPSDESDLLAHLAVTVVGNNWRPEAAQIGGGYNMDAMDLAVLFTYHLRPDQQVEDADKALEAADAVARLVGRESWIEGVTVETVTKARLQASTDSPYVLVESRFTVRFNPGD